MTKTQNVASFVLRFIQELWQDPEGEPHVRWRGYIKHVQGDEEERFTDFAAAVAFIQRYLAELTLDTLSGDNHMSQEKALKESFKLWEQFASSYTDMMLKTMNQAVRQSETFKEQMDEATEQVFKAWQFSGQSEEDTVLEALNNLQQQMQALTERLDRLEQKLDSEGEQGRG